MRIISLHEQIVCVRREIGMRERVYPKWVSAGRMKQDVADREIAAMRAVLLTLETITEVRDRTLEDAARIATDSCLVPPDGGSPSKEEVAITNAAAAAIRAAKSASSTGQGGTQ